MSLPNLSAAGFGFTIGDRVHLGNVCHEEFQGRTGTVLGVNISRREVRVEVDGLPQPYAASPEGLSRLPEEPDPGFVAWHTAQFGQRLALCRAAGLHSSLGKPDWNRLPPWVQAKIRTAANVKAGRADQEPSPAPPAKQTPAKAGPHAESSSACPACGETPEDCSFCADPARHFLDATVVVDAWLPDLSQEAPTRKEGTLYLCDNHAHTLLSEEARDGATDIEIGCYVPNNDCTECDTWA